MSSIRKNILVTLASSNANMVIGLATSIVLARLLSPTEIGIFSVAFAFGGLFRTIRELGIGAYIVQEPELTDDRFRSAFGVALLVSLLTCVVVAALAPSVGAFYRDEGITQVLYFLAANLLLAPFGSTSLALLRRDLRFSDMAIAETFATVVQSIAAITFAWLGFGYMSLAWSALIGVLASVLSAIYYRPPKIPWLPNLVEWKRVIDFCGFTSGSSLVGYANGAASDLILGRMLNLHAVAIFNRANGLAGMVGPVIFKAINTISLPYFTDAQRRGQSLRGVMGRSTALIGAVCLPLYGVLAIIAEPVILLLYGPVWADAAPILQILCLTAVVWTPGALTSQVLTAVGKVRLLFRLEVYGLVLKVALVIPAAYFGLHAVAWAFCLVNLIQAVQRLHAVSKSLGGELGAMPMFFSCCWYPTALACIGPLLLMQAGLAPALLVPLAVGSAALGWVAGALLTRGDLKDEVMGVLRNLKLVG